MILGTWFGGLRRLAWGRGAASSFGILGGALGGLLHAIVTVTFGVDHIISGVAINLLGAGLARYLSGVIFTGQHRRRRRRSRRRARAPSAPSTSRCSSGGWGSPDVLGSIEKHHWFLVSDVAGCSAA